MTQVSLSIPNNEVNFLTILAEKMGWKMEINDMLLDDFINSIKKDYNISDEEIQDEVNAVRYK